MSPGGAGLHERPRHFFLAEAFDHVADLDVVEVLDADTTLVSLLHFFHVVLEAAQGGDGTGVDLDAIADHADASLTSDDAVAHAAAGDGADARDLEDLADFRLAEDDLALLRAKEALETGPDVIHCLVDDLVQLDVDALAFSRRTRIVVRPDVEADDDGPSGAREQDI